LPQLINMIKKIASICICCLLFTALLQAQQITGVWKGKITKKGFGLNNSYKLELKLVQKGDSLLGTSYYYASANNYYRYSVKGYFNSETNAVIWWDDQLIESKTPSAKIFSPNDNTLLCEADFNCPGGGKMMLDGKANKKDDPAANDMGLHLDKVESPGFSDEWDFVIDNYTVGTNDPFIIDSVAAIAFKPLPVVEKPVPVVAAVPPLAPVAEKPVTVVTPPPPKPTPAPAPVVVVPPPAPVAEKPVPVEPKPAPAPIPEPAAEPPAPALVKQNEQPIAKVTEPAKPTPAPVVTPAAKNNMPAIVTTQEKFASRKKILATEIPVAGDSIELRFYDNAEVDGDSISLFLNGRLLFEHIRLSDKAYTIKLPVTDMQETNELIMVAENLGSIPPNTSLMIALVKDQRYEARLESTEQSSAMIRLRKAKAN
jgi:hypothetical protein